MASSHNSASQLSDHTTGNNGQPQYVENTFRLRTMNIVAAADNTSIVVSPWTTGGFDSDRKAPQASSSTPQRTMSFDVTETAHVEQTKRKDTVPQTTSEDYHAELESPTAPHSDDTDAAVLANLWRRARDVRHLRFEDAAWTLPALGPHLSIFKYISKLALDVNNAAEFVSNDLKVVIPTVAHLILRFLHGPSWAKPIITTNMERYPAVIVIELESPPMTTLDDCTFTRAQQTVVSQGRQAAGTTRAVPRIVGGLIDLWIHGQYFRVVDVEFRSLAGLSEGRVKLGSRLPVMRSIEFNLTNVASSTLSDLDLLLQMVVHKDNSDIKATGIGIHLRSIHASTLKGLGAFLVSVFTIVNIGYL